MDSQYWHRKWESNDIAFHEREAHPLLVRHWEALRLKEGARVFVPLCGKTVDIHWLLGQGFRVVGAELSRIAVEQLFADLGLAPEVTVEGEVLRYCAGKLDVYAGDIFAVSAEVLGEVDAVYDRAALVALPEGVRDRYAKHLAAITRRATQLVICFEYDQSVMQGPPFAIEGEALGTLYGEAYRLESLERAELVGGLKGKVAAVENAWLLRDGLQGVARRS